MIAIHVKVARPLIIEPPQACLLFVFPMPIVLKGGCSPARDKLGKDSIMIKNFLCLPGCNHHQALLEPLKFFAQGDSTSVALGIFYRFGPLTALTPTYLEKI